MNELDALKKLVAVLTNQRNFALDSLAKMEATMLIERDAAAAKAEHEPLARSRKMNRAPVP